MINGLRYTFYAVVLASAATFPVEGYVFERFSISLILLTIAEVFLVKNKMVMFWAIIINRFFSVIILNHRHVVGNAFFSEDIQLVYWYMSQWSYIINIIFYVLAINLICLSYLIRNKSPKLKTILAYTYTILIAIVLMSNDLFETKEYAKIISFCITFLGIPNGILYSYSFFKNGNQSRQKHILMFLYIVYTSIMIVAGVVEFRSGSVIGVSHYYPLLLFFCLLTITSNYKSLGLFYFNKYFKLTLVFVALFFVIISLNNIMNLIQASIIFILFLAEFVYTQRTKYRSVSV